MEAQKILALTDAAAIDQAIANYVQPLAFTDRMKAATRVICAHGDRETINGQTIYRLTITKENAGKKGAMSGSSLLRGFRELSEIELLEVSSITGRREYIFNFSRLEKIVPPPPARIEDLAICDPDWSPGALPASEPGQGQIRADQAGSAAPNLESNNFKSPSSKPNPTERSGLTDHPQGAGGDKWATFSVDDLRRAVRGNGLEFLRKLYNEAIDRKWVQRSDNNAFLFLCVCHHVATTPGVNNPRALLIAMVKDDRFLTTDYRHTTEDWAQAIMRNKHRDPALIDQRKEECNRRQLAANG